MENVKREDGKGKKRSLKGKMEKMCSFK